MLNMWRTIKTKELPHLEEEEVSLIRKRLSYFGKKNKQNDEDPDVQSWYLSLIPDFLQLLKEVNSYLSNKCV